MTAARKLTRHKKGSDGEGRNCRNEVNSHQTVEAVMITREKKTFSARCQMNFEPDGKLFFYPVAFGKTDFVNFASTRNYKVCLWNLFLIKAAGELPLMLLE